MQRHFRSDFEKIVLFVPLNLRKHIVWLIVISCVFAFSANTNAQYVENLIVETYYIADENDAASGSSEGIAPGTITYRLFLDMCAGCSLTKIYANTNHELRIESTENFFNASFGATYGHSLNGALFTIFDAAPLDSYLSFGAASTIHWGIEKGLDADGSVWNDRTPPLALTNQSSDLGVPLTTSDGLISAAGTSTTPVGWILPANNNEASSVFGNTTSSNSFVSQNIVFQSSNGAMGQNTDNLLLIAQLTTLGDLSFEINVEIKDSTGVRHDIVAVNPVGNELLSPYLIFPRPCGCTDNEYLEYNPDVLCDDGSCNTLIIFGCLNESACNYNPLANFDIPELCCFIDSCQGLDPSLICPTLDAYNTEDAPILIFPNPTSDFISISGLPVLGGESLIHIFDLTGKPVLEQSNIEFEGENLRINLRDLVPGIYVLNYYTKNKSGHSRIQIIK